jgi:hypothetical protein
MYAKNLPKLQKKYPQNTENKNASVKHIKEVNHYFNKKED